MCISQWTPGTKWRQKVLRWNSVFMSSVCHILEFLSSHSSSMIYQSQQVWVWVTQQLIRFSILTQLSCSQHLNTLSQTAASWPLQYYYTSITIILSESMTVSRRWAMVNTVWSWNSSLMMFWMILSVLIGNTQWYQPLILDYTHSRSTLAVASSNTRIWFLLNREIVSVPHWKLVPPSLTRLHPASPPDTDYGTTTAEPPWQ